MLINLKVKNFLSFKDETIFSMVANNDDVLENTLYKFKKLRLKKSVVIFGPNGSGKTNLIKTLALIKHLVLNSKDFEKNQKFMENPFKLNSKYGKNKPIEFEIEFLKNKNKYNYIIKISTKKLGEYNFYIEEEKLIKNDEIVYDFFEKNRTKSNYLNDKFKKNIEERIETKNKNKILLSYVKEQNFDDFDEVYDWFNTNLKILNGGETRIIDIESELEEESLKLEVLSYLNKLSFSKISNIKVEKKKRDVERLLKALEKEDFFSDKFKEELKKEKYIKQIKIFHKNELGEEIEFNLRNEESQGTNRFIELLVYILKAIKEEKVLVVDEIEDSLHPALLKKLYEIISLTTGKIQLIATTHAYPLLLYVNDEESEIFRRDQIYFTRLLKDESTQLYSLVNIGGIRKDLKIFKAYFDGRLEGFPNFEND